MRTIFYDYLNHFSELSLFKREEETFSYAFFKTKVDEKEKEFLKSGIKENDLVGIKIKDPIEFFSSLFALLKMKALAIPFSDKMPEENILNWSDELQLNFLIKIPKRFERKETGPTLCNKLNNRGNQSIQGPGVVILTSGSSGKPKGVLLKEQSLFYSALGTNQFYNFQSEDRWGLTLPHHHIAGLMIPLRCLLKGGSVILNDTNQPLPLFIKETKPTYLSLVPHQLKEIINFISDNEDNEKEKTIYPSLRAVLVGGAFLSLQLKKIARQKKIPLSPTFGLSEMSSQVTAQSPQDFLKEPPSNHIGSLLPYREMTVDKDQRILLGGKTIFSGYLSKKEFHSLCFSESAPNLWQSQDKGFLDQNSKLVLTGRQDKVFISGGENINPFEIEKVLMEHEGIDSAIIIPVPHVKYGQVPFAFFESKKEVSNHVLDSYCRKKLHPFKIPYGYAPLKKISSASIKPSKEELSLIAKQEITKQNIFFKTSGNPENPLLIFIHGFMGSHRDWDYFISKIMKKYYCVSLDLPGHGKTPLSLKSFEELSFQIKNLIQLLNKSNCYLIGYSLGGRIALDFFKRYPDLISGIILESCHPGLKDAKEKKQRIKSDEKLFSHFSNQDKESFFNFLNRWYQLPLFGSISNHKSFGKLLEKRMENNPIKLKSFAQYFSLGKQDYFFPTIYKSKIPILYITGDQDEKYTKIGKNLSSKSKSLNHFIIKDTSHNTHFEKPLDFKKLMLDFLDRLNQDKL